MPVYEVTTETVSIGQLRSIVQEIAELLESWKIGYLKIMYGYNCNLPVDELWCPEEIRVDELEGFIQRSERGGIFQFGRGDLHIEDSRETLEILLCHESDVHFRSKDQTRVEEITKLWRDKGLKPSTSSRRA